MKMKKQQKSNEISSQFSTTSWHLNEERSKGREIERTACERHLRSMPRELIVSMRRSITTSSRASVPESISVATTKYKQGKILSKRVKRRKGLLRMHTKWLTLLYFLHRFKRKGSAGDCFEWNVLKDSREESGWRTQWWCFWWKRRK